MTNTNKNLTIEQRLNAFLSEGLTSKTAYKTAFQNWLDLFIQEYDEGLNKNSLPLLSFLKKLDGIERTKIALYFKACTSLESLTVQEKSCKIKLKNGFSKLEKTNTSKNWFEMKVIVKPVTYDENKLKKSIDNLLKHYTKEDIQEILNTL